MFEPKTFYSVLTPMYYTTKVLGLTPFRINSESCGSSKISLAWSIIFLVFINIYAYTGIKIDAGTHYEVIETVTGFLDTYLGLGVMCCGILFGCIFRNDIISALEGIKSFDQNVQVCLHIDLGKEYEKSKTYTVLALCTAIVIAVFAMTFTTIGATDLFTFELFGEYVGYTGPYLVGLFVDLQFCTLLMCLKHRFAWLNEKLIAVSKNLENNVLGCNIMMPFAVKGNKVRPITHVVVTGFVQDRALYFIEKIRTNHYQLCKIGNTINKAYSVQILLIVLQNFITIIVSFYYSGKHLIADKVVPVEYLTYSAIQLTLATGQILALVIFCSTTAAEAQKMGILIHKVAGNSKLKTRCKEELQLEIAFFSLQLLHHNMEFTACQIFVINETLIFSIVGAITTYLVIVIQFEIGNFQRQEELLNALQKL